MAFWLPASFPGFLPLEFIFLAYMIVDGTAVIDKDVLPERNHGSFLPFHESVVYVPGISPQRRKERDSVFFQLGKVFCASEPIVTDKKGILHAKLSHASHKIADVGLVSRERHEVYRHLLWTQRKAVHEIDLRIPYLRMVVADPCKINPLRITHEPCPIENEVRGFPDVFSHEPELEVSLPSDPFGEP